MHRGRNSIVGRLAAVDVVVRMNGRLAAALAPERLVGDGRDHLVGVHVGLGAGSGLPDDERELLVVLAGHDLGRSRRDRIRDLGVELTEVLVHEGCGLLHEPERAHERDRHALAPDPEVLDRTLRLRAPIAVRRHLDRPERVGFGAGLSCR
jgi:hypothetical protein